MELDAIVAILGVGQVKLVAILGGVGPGAVAYDFIDRKGVVILDKSV